MQPLINPLYQSRSPHELIGTLMGTPQTNPYDIVRATYVGQVSNLPRTTENTSNVGQVENLPHNDEKRWRRILHDGIVPDSAAVTINVTPTLPPAAQPLAPAGSDYEIIFRPDPAIYDGRYANNGWLQELPKPLTSLTWDNVALISQRTAQQLGFTERDTFAGGGVEVGIVKLTYQGRELEAPAWVLPNHPDGAVTVYFGYGRTHAGAVGNGVGYNAYQLRTSDAPWQGVGLRVTPTGRRATLASTQVHFVTEDREPVRVSTLDEYRAKPNEALAEGAHVPPPDLTFYPQYEYDYHRWGMAIDNHACIGCNACVVACQAENNVPVVGKEQVLRSREMHWLRIDTYYHGENDFVTDAEGPYFQPLMCVHCEQAPCEPVCPVHATVHDAEGLNVQVYNRCIGTRYCSNNCPYKVRRFNFLLYQDWNTEQYKMARNPEVSVRSRGVMEKCTYCTQRIQDAKINATKEGRKVRDGEIITACQAACPTEAIIFGDLNDPEARVTKIRQDSKRQYPLLGELNTRPRTWHLGEVRNPNPEIKATEGNNG